MDDLAEEWGVSARALRKRAARLHDRYGYFRRVGRAWLIPASEVECLRPGPPGNPNW